MFDIKTYTFYHEFIEDGRYKCEFCEIGSFGSLEKKK